MAKNYFDITIALAGITQAARLVQQLAHSGQCDNDAFSTSLSSIIRTDVPSTIGVFGDIKDIKLGLASIPAILSGQREQLSNELTRYTISLMVLERKLNANRAALNELASRISQLDRQLEHYPIDSEILINAIASIYVDIISPLGPKIQVIGSAESPTILQQPLVQAKVRASLLAGIRATVLWQQVGGSRLQFFFSRGRLLQQSQQIFAQC